MKRWVRAALAVLCALPWPACGSDPQREPDSGSRNRPEAAAPAIPALRRTPPLGRADRVAWRTALGWPAECEEAFRASAAGDDAGLDVVSLGNGHTLVAVTCAAGTYQPSHVFVWTADDPGGERARLLRFPVLTSPDGTGVTRAEATEVWGELLATPGREELRVLAFSRQTRDCGIWSRYRVTEQGAEWLESWARLPCPSSPGDGVELAEQPPTGWRRVATK